MPCIQPTAVNQNKMTKRTSRTTRADDHPVRHNKSANSMETKPVRASADEKKINNRQPRARGTWTGLKVGASAMMGQVFKEHRQAVEEDLAFIDKRVVAVRQPKDKNKQQAESHPGRDHPHIRVFSQVRQRGD